MMIHETQSESAEELRRAPGASYMTLRLLPVVARSSNVYSLVEVLQPEVGHVSAT